MTNRTYHPTTVKNVLSAVKVRVRDGSVIREISAQELLENKIQLFAQSAQIHLDENIYHQD